MDLEHSVYMSGRVTEESWLRGLLTGLPCSVLHSFPPPLLKSPKGPEHLQVGAQVRSGDRSGNGLGASLRGDLGGGKGQRGEHLLPWHLGLLIPSPRQWRHDHRKPLSPSPGLGYLLCQVKLGKSGAWLERVTWLSEETRFVTNVRWRQ